jgi:hypothetical protein
MFRNNFLTNLGEADYCERSIDSMIFHTSRCIPTYVSSPGSMLLYLWLTSSTRLLSQTQ